MSPFLRGCDVVDPDVIELVEQFSAFDFVLSSVERLPGLVWIRPEPEVGFLALIDAVTARWDIRPYGGEHLTVIPHLTVAWTTDEAALDDAERQLRDTLPISARAREVWLLEEGRGLRSRIALR